MIKCTAGFLFLPAAGENCSKPFLSLFFLLLPLSRTGKVRSECAYSFSPLPPPPVRRFAAAHSTRRPPPVGKYEKPGTRLLSPSFFLLTVPLFSSPTENAGFLVARAPPGKGGGADWRRRRREASPQKKRGGGQKCTKYGGEGKEDLPRHSSILKCNFSSNYVARCRV